MELLGKKNINDYKFIFLKCPVCNSSFDYHSENLVCKKCKEIYPIIEGIPILLLPDEIKEIKEVYEKHYEKAIEDIRKSKNIPHHCIADLKEIKKLKISNSILIDAGGGRGFIAKNVINDVDTLIVIDLSFNALKELKRLQKDNIILICADLEKNIFKEDFADIITCTAVLEHLENPSLVLKNFNNILNDEGEIYIQVPVINLPFKKKLLYIFRKLKRMKIEKVEKIHLQIYSDEVIIRDLSAAGFSIESINHISLINEFNLPKNVILFLEGIFFRSFLKKYLASNVQISGKKIEKTLNSSGK